MRYLRLLIPAAALLLLLPAAASAKEITRAEVCGSDDCVVLTDRGALRALIDLGPPTGRAPAPAPYYRVRVTISGGDHSETSTLLYVPAAGRFRAGGPVSYDWLAGAPGARALLADAAGGLEPFPAARLRREPQHTVSTALDRTTTGRAAADGGGFPWAIPAVLVGMLGVFGLGLAGQRSMD